MRGVKILCQHNIYSENIKSIIRAYSVDNVDNATCNITTMVQKRHSFLFLWHANVLIVIGSRIYRVGFEVVWWSHACATYICGY